MPVSGANENNNKADGSRARPFVAARANDPEDEIETNKLTHLHLNLSKPRNRQSSKATLLEFVLCLSNDMEMMEIGTTQQHKTTTTTTTTPMK